MGGIFSDNSVDISIDKITQVYVRLGFIEQLLFKTGSVTIKTAGSGVGKIVLKSIDNPMEVYEDIQNRMRKNGFKLKKEHLVQEGKPHFLGIFGESIKGMVGNVFVLIYIVFSLLDSSEKSSEKLIIDGGEVLAHGGETGAIYLVGAVVAFFIIKFTVNYLDLKKRLYQIYDDSVFYSEGFLNKHFAFLPMEKIADTENSQSFLSKIFGIHDVIISSEGSSNQIYFFNMVNGVKMMENIKYLKGNISLTPVVREENHGTVSDISHTSNTLQSTSQIPTLNYDESFLGSYRPSMKKVLIFNIPLFLPIVTIPMALINIIKAMHTYFIVGKKSIDFKYEFLTTKSNSFSVDRITQVIFTESLLDKWIGTCSIIFYSIGSQVPIVFSDIAKSADLYENILSKVGIYKKTTPNLIPNAFSIVEYLKSQVWGTLLIGFLALGSILVFFLSGEFLPVIIVLTIAGLILVYKKYYYSDTYYSNSAYEYFIENISGIIIKKTSYVTFDDIKAMEAKKYPLTHVGSLKFDVSGDAQVSYGTGAKQFQIVNNIVKIDFVGDVFEKVNIFDAILNNHKALNTQLEVEKKQDLGNSLIGIVIISILVMSVFGILFLADSEIFPFSFLLSAAIFFGGVIALNIWLIKSVRYILEGSRLVKYWGIIYTSKRSILYTKVDFIEKNQGMVNKIFGNGIIAIFTKGSSGKDMIFKDVSLHNELYETLLEKIQKGENQ